METISSPITPVLPDLAACADEPIRVPGAVQPHGWLLVMKTGGPVIAHGDNWPQGVDPAALVEPLRPALATLVAGDAPAPVGIVMVGGTRCDVSAHCSGVHTIIEFEQAAMDDGTHAPIYTLARHFLPQLQQAHDLDRLLVLAAQEMKRLSGFGRCLIYRFDANGHGEVLAEVADEDYDSYSRHHFPASDIPAQARALYLLNHFRLIPDANYTPVALRVLEPGLAAGSFDLSFAALRSVSPVHLEFMRNMGTMASMSVSIVVRGKLWGLVSCHDHAPKRLHYPTRVACEHLGRLLSLQVEAKEDNAEVATRLELRRLTLEIVSHLAESDATLQRLVDEPRPLLRLADAAGAAVVLDGTCWSVGETPSTDMIREIADRVGDLGEDAYATDALGADFPSAQGQDVSAGVLAISISKVHRHLILWFRPEIVRTIHWAGQPGKEARGSDGRIHPRRSFTSWEEEVRGRSAPWTAVEKGAALELRQALVGIVLHRAQEVAEMATELGRVNKELEAFSYTVSHDLRAPMRHIAGYVDLVLEQEKALDERSTRYLAHVKEASIFAGQLVDALLDFSRMGRSALKRKAVDSHALVEGLVREVQRQETDRRIEWDIRPGLPSLHADPFLLQVAVRNLLSNGAKYTRQAKTPRITVSPIHTPEGDGIEVSDNGVGFQMQYAGKLFEVFQRLHKAEDFEGTGIGLASVRRIVDRHGGKVWARGEPGVGATFGFTLPGKEQD